MLQKGNRLLSMKTVVWLFPVVFLIHDAEELWLIERWWQMNGAAVGEVLDGTLMLRVIEWVNWTTPKFAIAVAILFVLICLICYRVTSGKPSNSDHNWFVVGISVAFVNVFTHTAQAIAVGGYVPGLVTGWLVLFPYSACTFYRIYREGWIGGRLLTSLVALSVFVVAGSAILA